MPDVAPATAPRPYPNLLAAVADGLDEVFNRGYYADRVVAQLLKRDKRWGSRDRAFIAETVYNCVRWWRLLAFVAESEMPEAIVSAYWAWHYGEALDVPGFPFVHAGEVERRLRRAEGRRALLQSIPDWIDARGEAELAERWPETLRALNEPASVYLRANTLKTERDALLEDLSTQGFELVRDPRGDQALRVLKRRNLWATAAFKAGHFEVQDIASQQVAPALEVAPGMTVVDACAGAGGKTLHLAALMRNRGRLIALDTSARKLAELKKRARRAGVDNLDIRHIDSTKVVKRLRGKADRVLLDVPCTGLGVLRRNPDAKWKLKASFLEEVLTWQRDILDRYTAIAKPDGLVAYATCSILPSESEEQVSAFAKTHGEWRIRDERRYSPVDDYDGFYVAKLVREGVE